MWYRSGTVFVTNGSTAVTGSGTDWISGAGVGESFYGPDGRLYEIAAITSATTLTLGSVYLGATTSGQVYQIVPTQSYIRDLAAQAAQLVADYGNVVSNVGAGKFQDGTLAQPGLRFASDENTGIRRAGSDELRLVAGGVDQARVSVAGLSVDQGKLVLEGASVANAITYLNGSKQLVSGSGLTFDGTNLGVGTSSPGYKLDVAGTLNVVNGSNGRINIGAPSNYLYGDSTGNLIIGTSGSDKLQVDAAGNLGLGVTPSAWIGNRKTLQIGGLAVANINYASSIGENAYNFYYNNNGSAIYQNNGPAAVFDFNNSASGGFAWKTAPSGTAGNAISFTQAMTLGSNGKLLVGTTADNGGFIQTPQLTVGTAGVAGTYGLQFWPNTPGGSVYLMSNDGMGALTFSTGGNFSSSVNVKAMTLDASGNLLVGRTDAASDTGSVGVAITNGTTYANGRWYGTGSHTFHQFFSAGTAVGSITGSGTSTSYNTSSDYRLKNISGPISTSGSYIDSLNPVEGTWKADGSTFVGLIAHEAQEASRTNVAAGEKDAIDDSGKPIMQAMDYSSPEIIANMIAELKSLRARVAQLESN